MEDDDGLDKYDLTADPELATKTLIIRRKDGDRAGSPSADRTSSRASSDCSCSCSGGECSCEESDDDKRNSFSSQRNRNQQQRRGGHEDHSRPPSEPVIALSKDVEIVLDHHGS